MTKPETRPQNERQLDLNDLLKLHGFDPRAVLVLRHRPHEPTLRRVFPWIAAERPELFNAFQQTQSLQLERAMQRMVGDGLIDSFIGQEPATAVFVGLYRISASRALCFDEYWSIPAYRELRKRFGMQGWLRSEGRDRQLWFDLDRVEFHTDWKGRLIVGWPPPERSWWRRAHRNTMPVHALLEESRFTASMPEWEELEFTWAELGVLPRRWKAILSQWRGVYFIFDQSDRKGYVGSAYGENNLLGRWLNYASGGDGGDKLLKGRDPHNFSFTILQRVSPDMEPPDVIQLEGSWKRRLHTLKPLGLNCN